MNAELKYAQKNLTESVIRKFWKAMTLSYPSMCVSNGVSINYHKHLDIHHFNQIVDQLTKCKSNFVATPLFQFEYEPKNTTPHHVSSLTLTKTPTYYVLSLFDPKGSGSMRKKEEELFMNVLSKGIERKMKKPVHVKIYTGTNLQRTDFIGLCQLFSLYYLYEYILEVSKVRPQSLQVTTDPNNMVPYIQKKRGKFNDKLLLNFWNTFFKSLK
jgi:hypothetical protein